MEDGQIIQKQAHMSDKKKRYQSRKKKRGQSLFQSFKPVIKCDNLNSNPKRKFGREW